MGGRTADYTVYGYKLCISLTIVQKLTTLSVWSLCALLYEIMRRDFFLLTAARVWVRIWGCATSFAKYMQNLFFTFESLSSENRILKVLNKQVLKKAEEALRLYFPASQLVYGYVCRINRVDVDPTDVLVDQWPNFRVLLVKPRQQQDPDLIKHVCIFTKDKSCLMNILTRTDVLDWKKDMILSVDQQHEAMIKAVAANKSVPINRTVVGHLMRLQDPSKLKVERSSFQVSSVKESHAALINSKWEMGTGERTEPLIRNMIRKFPSCCVLDSEGRPVSWLLTYPSCEMGVMHTLPEHRQKGYAKALVTILAKKLHSDGYPVYCSIKLENQPSYRLFTSLGFTRDLPYRNAWLYFNQASMPP
ncbi:glycine N-acyltransferase-like protein 3 isoform X2 [Tachysurus fulvidraco]|uniref:glycine N-acyltransferase-like protein 3 isoform X2 n=1 Tax=Tachysurus fulvidraco TaxID=1234273 RepID=UPI001FED92FB|nr:glycine N-acyltransferase-like protein 3 isoform X2 [Tachysurus fulvidraco]